MVSMKCSTLANYISVLSLAAGLQLGVSSVHAGVLGGAVQFAQVDIHVPGVHIEWGDDRRKRLRKAFWILQQSDRDYHGHRAAAVDEVRKAAHIIGMDLHGEGYGGEHFHWSDEHLREARDILSDLEHDSGGREREHLHTAVHELDRALETR